MKTALYRTLQNTVFQDLASGREINKRLRRDIKRRMKTKRQHPLNQVCVTKMKVGSHQYQQGV